MVRMRAVISLHKLAHNSNERVLNILSSAFHNAGDDSEVINQSSAGGRILRRTLQVRMAAFSLLVLANPPAFRWQKIAVSTWFEQNAQVASFVYTTFASLASIVHPPGNLKEM